MLTRVKAGNKVDLQSQGDTNLIGAVVTGKQVTADVGKNLNIASVQDTSSFHSKDENIGGSVTMGAGFSGSVSAGSSKVDGEYASVGEQAGINAGDNGFQIKVNGNTDLKGGKIASTDKAVEQNKYSLSTVSLTTSDIENRSQYSAESISVSAGGGDWTGKGEGKPGGGLGVGSASGNATSTTKSGISEIAGDTSVRSNKDTSNSLKKDWNGDALRDDVQAQAQITQAFGQQAAKAIGDYAKEKQMTLEKAAKRAELDGNIEQSNALNAEAANWADGGAYRVAAHAAAGLLGGGVAGALGATASAALMPELAKQIDKMGLPDPVKSAVALAAAAGMGAVVGGTAGAASGFNVDFNNRQLHQGERDWARQNAKKFAAFYQEKMGEAITLERAEQILLGNGYRMVDASASKGPGVVGPAGDAVAVAFISQNAGSLFKATAAERNNPGQLGGPLTQEQLALPGAVGNPVLGVTTAALITGGLAAPAILAIPGTPIFSAGGALGSGMWASPLGTALISAGINSGAQYVQNGSINPVDVAVSAATGGIGAYGGLLWNMGVNAAGGAAGTAINNYLNGQSSSVMGSAISSGVLSAFGYGAGKLGESGINAMLRPTINSRNWTTINIWSSGGWNMFRKNNVGVIGGSFTGGLGQEAVAPMVPKLETKK